MGKICAAIGTLLTLSFMGCSAQSASGEAPSPDFGFPVPGPVAEIAAPGIVNTEENREAEGMFGADMNTFYFIRRLWGEDEGSNVLVLLEFQEGQWRESIVIRGESEPSVSPDGTRIYFSNQFIERTDEGWSQLQSLGAPFADMDIFRVSAAASGTLYLDMFTPELDAPLLYSRLINGQYEEPQSLGPQFDVGTYNAHPYIAPDESYVIWDSRRDGGFGSSDLYISYRTPDGTWGSAINMGDQINTAADENYPSVSPDGRFLIFDRRGEPRPDGERSVDIFWVDAQIIEELRPRR